MKMLFLRNKKTTTFGVVHENLSLPAASAVGFVDLSRSNDDYHHHDDEKSINSTCGSSCLSFASVNSCTTFSVLDNYIVDGKENKRLHGSIFDEQKVAVVAPAQVHEGSSLTLSTLPSFALYNILSYLDANSYRSISQVNMAMRQSLVAPIAGAGSKLTVAVDDNASNSDYHDAVTSSLLWHKACRQIWAYLPPNDVVTHTTGTSPSGIASAIEVKLVDSLLNKGSIVGASYSMVTSSPMSVPAKVKINYPFLLALSGVSGTTQRHSPNRSINYNTVIPTARIRSDGTSEFVHRRRQDNRITNVTTTPPHEYLLVVEHQNPNERTSSSVYTDHRFDQNVYHVSGGLIGGNNDIMKNNNNNNDGTTDVRGCGTVVVHYIGLVGFGNRCVRSMQPFYRPSKITKSQLIVTPSPNSEEVRSQPLLTNEPKQQQQHQYETYNSNSKFPLRRRRRLPNRRLVVNCGRSDDCLSPNDTSSELSLSTMPWKPFVMPFCCSSAEATVSSSSSGIQTNRNYEIVEMEMMPRLVSYFEVSILPIGSGAGVVADERMLPQGSRRAPCVAVGLSLNDFLLTGKMPGWDDFSYGYHSDDGYAYHVYNTPETHTIDETTAQIDNNIYDTSVALPSYSRTTSLVSMLFGDLLFRSRRHLRRGGENSSSTSTNNSTEPAPIHTAANNSSLPPQPQLREPRRLFGPTFGVNDTVGCGLDYHKRAIFFTLNGTFLGYAFDDIPIRTLHLNDFYPVVGIDTNDPVSINFGTDYTNPFVFDLKSYIVEHQRDVICETLGITL